MIYFITKEFNTKTHKRLGNAYQGKFKVYSYNQLLGKFILPRGTYIFTDRELMDLWELRVYGKLYEHLKNAGPGYHVLNNPARMCNRQELLRLLHREGINNFNIYPVSEKPGIKQFPVFIRRIFNHRVPLTDLLYNQHELDQALSRLRQQNEPDEGTIIVEYCAEPVLDDLFRKLSFFRIGKNVFFYNTAHERNCLIKYGTMNSATEALYREEYQMIKNNRYKEVMEKVFNLANIEYGRADCGLVNGKLQVYEINTNPTIYPPFRHPNATRQKSMQLSWSIYTQALNGIDIADVRAKRARPFRHPDHTSILQHILTGQLIKRD